MFDLYSSSRGLILHSFIIMMTAILISGCLGGGDNDDDELSISGSTTMFPIVEEASKCYMELHPDIHIIITSGGSGKGVKDVGLGKSDLGMASRNLKDSELDDYPELKSYKIANDGLSVIVHEGNPLANLTMEQLNSVFSGDISNWKELGGDDQPISLVGRDDLSGTRATFDEIVMGDIPLSPGMTEEASNDNVHDRVKGDRYSIGYVGYGFLGNGTKAIELDGIAPTIESVQDGSYPISRPLNIVSNGETDGQTGEFIDFLKSEDGQKIIEGLGFIPLV